MSKRVNVVVALKPEAKPLIEHYDLKLVKGAPFKHYQGENINLIISGLGSDLAAAACGYLFGLQQEAPAGWLNVGIGGHADLALGSLVVASAVVDLRVNIEIPMRLYGLPELQASKITSHFQTNPRYPEDTVCDMEAAGFVAACRALSGPRGIAVLKIISDNLEHPVEEITPALATDLLSKKLPEIEMVIQALINLNQQVRS
jgi:nucleoside phosphorylase